MNAIRLTLIDRLNNAEAIIGIIGLGYVGLPLSLRFSEAGYKVLGFDIDASKANRLKSGESYISHINNSRIKRELDAGLEPTTDFSRISEVDAVIICVPTPLKNQSEPDLGYVVNTMETICPYLKAGQVVSLESTTYPGTTEEEIVPRIRDAGFEIGEQIFVVYSPEREDPGNLDFNAQEVPKICAGFSQNCLDAGMALYGKAINTLVPVSSLRVAEFTKLHENIYRAVNIGMVNEMKIVADKMDVDIHEVIEAAKTKPFGFTAFYPGPGLGGHCLPIDPFYLSWKAKQIGVNSGFIKLAGEVNTNMPNWVFEKAEVGLIESGKTVKDARILILGLAYKKNIDDMRESPAMAILNLFTRAGAQVDYYDPYVAETPPMRKYAISLKSIEFSGSALESYDEVILVTDHDCFDYALIQKHSKLIIDSRGRYAGLGHKNVVQA